MSKQKHQESILDLLQKLRGLEPLKELFWFVLSSKRENQLLNKHG